MGESKNFAFPMYLHDVDRDCTFFTTIITTVTAAGEPA
jgi:hypothetical protein